MATTNALGGAVAQIQGSFSRLSEREKRLVLLTVTVATVLLLLGGVTVVNSALDKREKRVAARMNEIEQLDGLRDQYLEAVAAETRSAQRMKTNTTSLFSLMQKSAAEVGLSINDLNERRTPVKDEPDLSEITVDLNLKEISVDKLTTLLEKIEGRRSDGVVKVTKLRVKTKHADPTMLEASMTVSTWRSAAAPATSTGAP